MQTTSKRVCSGVGGGVVAALLVLVGLVVAPSAGAVATVATDRIEGANRYATAVALARDAFPTGATDVVLVTGENFPDALAGNALAGALNAPILLTASAQLSPETQAYLADPNVADPVRVHVLGGTAAVSGDVVTAVEAAVPGATVVRHEGATRFATAAAIAADVAAAAGDIPGLTDPTGTSVIVARGDTFPDALTAGPLAFAGPHPVLLTRPHELPTETAAAITSLGATDVVVLGGEAAVSLDVQRALEPLVGGAANVVRLGGATRFDTATAIASAATAAYFPGGVVGLTTGFNFADALAAGPWAGTVGAPLVLAGQPDEPALPDGTVAWLNEASPSLATVVAIGGTEVVPAAIVAAAADASAAGIQLGAAEATNAFGTEHSIIVQITGGRAPYATGGEPLVWNIVRDGAPVMPGGPVTTTAAGTAVLTYVGPDDPAPGTEGNEVVDTVNVWWDLDGDAALDAGEPSAKQTKTWAETAGTVSVDAVTSSNVFGEPHTVVATFLGADGTTPQAGATLSYTVDDGTAQTVTTGPDGTASITVPTVADPNAGTAGDQATTTIIVWSDQDADGVADEGEPSATQTKTWVESLGTLALDATASTNDFGEPHTVVATLVAPDGTTPLADATVAYTVAGGQVQTATTGVNGATSLTVPTETDPAATLGDEVVEQIVVWYDQDGDGAHDAGEPTATQTKTWTELPTVLDADYTNGGLAGFGNDAGDVIAVAIDSSVNLALNATVAVDPDGDPGTADAVQYTCGDTVLCSAVELPETAPEVTVVNVSPNPAAATVPGVAIDEAVDDNDTGSTVSVAGISNLGVGAFGFPALIDAT